MNREFAVAREERNRLERQADGDDRRFAKILISQVDREYLDNTMPSIRLHPIVKALERAKPSECAAIMEGFRSLRRLMDEE